MMDPPYSGPKMEARSTVGGGVVHVPREVEVLAQDPFFYGYRWVRVETARGAVHEQVPLTRADLLDPQEDDKVSNHSWHEQLTSRICEVLRCLFMARGRLNVLVSGDLKMLWKDPKIHRVSPDVAVTPHVKNPDRGFSSFNQEKEGTRPVFALEVVSKATVNTDYDDKPSVYRQAGVEEYFILDSLQTPWTILGRRLNPPTGRYRKIRPDTAGRVASEQLEVLFEIGPDGKSLVLTDARTGELLRNLTESEEARRVAEAEVERLKALLEGQRC